MHRHWPTWWPSFNFINTVKHLWLRPSSTIHLLYMGPAPAGLQADYLRLQTLLLLLLLQLLLLLLAHIAHCTAPVATAQAAGVASTQAALLQPASNPAHYPLQKRLLLLLLPLLLLLLVLLLLLNTALQGANMTVAGAADEAAGEALQTV